MREIPQYGISIHIYLGLLFMLILVIGLKTKGKTTAG